MVKAPRPGEVKSRLTPTLTPGQACLLYRAFLTDISSNLSGLKDVDLIVLYAPVSGRAEVEEFFPSVCSLIPQKGNDLGEKLSNAFEGLFKLGYDNVVLIGSDSPDLPRSFIDAAFAGLESEKNSVVIGPAVDGGYYLIGISEKPCPILFDHIAWSTERVLKQTVERAVLGAMTVTLLDQWHDIDLPEDLALLRDNKNAPASSDFIKSMKLDL